MSARELRRLLESGLIWFGERYQWRRGRRQRLQLRLGELRTHRDGLR
jgi:hypothetical protein